MRLYVVRVGELCCDPGLFEFGADVERVHVPVHAFVVILGDGSVLLVDTGLSLDELRNAFGPHEIVEREREMDAGAGVIVCGRPADHLLGRLARLGISPSDVSYVINTVDDFVHTGNNALFPDARFFAPGERGSGGRLGDVGNGAEVVPGVRVLDSPGGASPRQSVILDLPQSGRIVLCGDAIPTGETLLRDSWSGRFDPAQARASALRLKAAADAAAGWLVFGSDPQQAATLLRPPLFYE